MKRYAEATVLVNDMPSRREDAGRLYWLALATLAFLVAGTVLYPDTMVSQGWHVGSLRISSIGILFIITAPAIGWYAWKRRTWLALKPVDLMLLLILIYICVRGLLASTNSNELGLVLAYIGYTALLYYGTAIVGQRQGALSALYQLLAILGVIVAIYALLEFILGENVIFGSIISEDLVPFASKGYHRSGSFLGHPVALGTFMVQLSPFFIFYYVRAVGTARRVAWATAIILVMLSLLVTYSKGAWGATAVLITAGLFWVLLQRSSVTRSILMLFLAVAIVIGAFTVAFYDAVNAGTTSKARTSESFKPRIYMWTKVPDTFLANPLTGAGLWQANAEVFRINPAPEVKNRPTSIDNMYLTALVEQGLIGFLLAATTFIMIGRQAWKLIRRGGSHAIWGLPVAASMLLIMILGFSSNVLMIWPNMVIFWLTAGMIRAMIEGSCH